MYFSYIIFFWNIKKKKLAKMHPLNKAFLNKTEKSFARSSNIVASLVVCSRKVEIVDKMSK